MSEYILYKGEEVIGVGTAEELASLTGVKVKTLRQYGTPSYQKRHGGGIARRLVKCNPGPAVYALYKGEEILGIGTQRELAEEMGIQLETLQGYGTPSYKRKTSEDGGRRLVKLEG